MVSIRKTFQATPGLTRENNRLRIRLNAEVTRFAVLLLQLKSESAKRRGVEAALKNSEKHHILLLDQSRQMQEHLRHLTRKILTAQEDERREISRELHDEIAQTLTASTFNWPISNVKPWVNAKGLKGKISGTQRLVRKSVGIVHRFARRLRPALLDDLGSSLP